MKELRDRKLEKKKKKKEKIGTDRTVKLVFLIYRGKKSNIYCNLF